MQRRRGCSHVYAAKSHVGVGTYLCEAIYKHTAGVRNAHCKFPAAKKEKLTEMDFTVLRRLNATILLVCVISVLIYLADSAPAPTEPNAAATTQTNQVSRQSVRKPLSKPWEEAREIWNGLRVAKKQNSAARERRDAPDPTQVSPQADYSDLNNLSIPIPTYMKELYWNLSRQESEDADTTTIRSMPGLETGNGE